ncbi:nSTAND1 domain-containing NTPase, partial [Scytonema sp. HK-05]|uniref:nSTAND1 domain-containing NTPase n=1 Tax=Scytonema sp. HK-05 TaxID=1137095 RepID=UPI001E5664FA
MNTFEITIQRKSGDRWPIVVEHNRRDVLLPIRSEGIFEFNQQDFQDLISLLGQPKEYGTRLGKALFCDEVRDAFVGALRDSTEPLRVLLFIEAEDIDIRTLRWERLCANIDDNWYFLALEQRTPFSLYIPAITDRRFPPIGRLDLRALVLVASPSGLGKYSLDSFDVEATVNSVRQALGKIPCDVLAFVDKAIGPPNLDELCKQLTDQTKQYTLLHFVCHGKLIEQSETVLYWAKADNSVEVVTGTRLLERLRSLRGARGLPHFAFLSTCESASSAAEQALGGLGQRLVRNLGMPAVVAMTEKVTIRTAQVLAENFYKQLQQSGEVDLALCEATATLAERYDITVPALFSRLGGRPLFSDQLDQDLKNSAIEFGLECVQNLLPERAPVLQKTFEEQAQKLKQTLDADVTALSKQARLEKEQALVEVNNLCDQALDLSFNALALGQKPPKYDSRCPFQGLYAFGVEQREFFFGRKRLIEQLQEKLAKHNFLAILGASGTGKSSVVLAGLIPQLQQKQPNLQMAYLTPSSEPLVQLKVSLSHILPNKPSILVVDQFEELFTLCTDETKRVAFIDQLLAIAQQQKVILTMRADFWGECATYTQLKELMQVRQELIAPMDSSELREAMEMQAAKVGLRFEAGLSNLILDNVQGEPGAMPLLQHALLELWKRRHGRWLCCEEYEKIGGVQQAIAKTADDVYNNLSEDEKDQVRNIFIRLTRLDETAVQGEKRRDTRRRVGLEELVAIGGELAVTKKLVQQLAGSGARLVVTSRNETTGKEEVEVAHEALIRYWPRLQDWLDENRTNLLLREKIRSESLEWNQHQRDEDYLELKGAQLVVSESLLQQPMFLNKLEAEYVKACVELRDRLRQQEEERRQRELEQEKKARKAAQSRNRVATISAGVLAVLAGFALYQWREAGRQSVNALAQTFEASLLSNRQLEAMVAAIQAGKQLKAAYLEQDPSASQSVSTVLQQAIYNVQEHNRLEGHSKEVLSVALSRDGKTLASGSDDNTIKLWDVATSKELKTLNRHSSSVSSVAFSPDGKTLASGSYDNTIKLWDVATSKELKTLNRHSGSVNSVAFSPDGKTLASGSSDNTIKLWDVATSKELKTLNGHSGSVNSVAFSRDGKTLASAS